MDSREKSNPCCLEHDLDAMGRRLRKAKDEMETHKCNLWRFRGDMREWLEQLVEDIHEVRVVQREQATTKDNRL